MLGGRGQAGGAGATRDLYTQPDNRFCSRPQITSYLNRLASDLEAAAYPALDALTSRVTAHNLERVRRIKGRLVRLSTRVQTVRARGARCAGPRVRPTPQLAPAPRLAYCCVGGAVGTSNPSR